MKKKSVAQKKATKKTIWCRAKLSVRRRLNDYLARRPHRSFHKTKMRDCKRSFDIPKYFVFSKQVKKILWDNKKVFGVVMIFYVVLSGLLVGLSSQELFSALSSTIKTASRTIAKGDWTGFSDISKSFVSAVSGNSSTLTDAQMIYSCIIALLVWLTTVWFLRNILAGRKFTIRDGLYNAGAPIIPLFLVTFVIFLQLIPFALASIGYGAATLTGLLNSGVEAMLFWAAAGALVLVSIYFVIGTVFALVIITLPGMYPLLAIKTAGDLVVGRRFRILMRLLWCMLEIGVFWLITMLPLSLLDSWVKSWWKAISSVPTMPCFVLVMSALSLVYFSAYLYLLYRKVVDDGTKPA